MLEKVGKYEVIRVLGKGATAVVYLGRDPKLNREVAIKTMALAQEFDPAQIEEARSRFFRVTLDAERRPLLFQGGAYRRLAD